MSHEIYQNRFAGYRKPAWHRLGKVFQEPLNAMGAWELMGPYDVSKQPLFYKNWAANPDGFSQIVDSLVSVPGKYAVIGRFPDTGKTFNYGLVDERYELITPEMLVKLWDTVVSANIETMGVLQDGKRFFVTTELPGFDVRGDEHKNYLSILSPHATGQALVGLISPVRVVCANTAQMALEAAQQQCRVPHFKGAINKIGGWLKEQYESTVQRSETLKEAMEILAYANVGNEATVEKYVENVFPMPKDEESKAADKVQDDRYNVTELFNGKARGSHTESFRGTYFGMYQSVVEHLDYYSKGKQTVFTGAAAKVKEHAFSTAMKMVGA